MKLSIKKTEKLIVLLGPTSSGKSDLAVKLALWLNSKQIKKKFKIKGAEVISADSRQVYKGMNVGSGKITKKEMKKIPHHCLDIASPKRKFTVAQYKKSSLGAIKKIHQKEKIPILCGGSAFYIYAVTQGIKIPEIPPDWQLRKELEKKSNKELLKILKKFDPERAKNIDKNNPRRLIRAVEIVLKTNRKIPRLKQIPVFKTLKIGPKKNPEKLKKLIKKRLLKRLSGGKMIKEVKNLQKSGLSWKRLEGFGLEYRFASQYLQEKINYNQMIDLIQKESQRFVKRQMTWFKQDKTIFWIKNYKESEKLVKKFLLES